MNDLLQEEEGGQGRIILATLLIIIVWVGWGYLFPAKPAPQAAADAASDVAAFLPVSGGSIAAASTIAPLDGVSDGQSDASSDGNSDSIVASSRPSVPVEQFYNFSNDTSDIVLSAASGAFSRWDLKNFSLRAGENETKDGNTDLSYVSMVATEQLRLSLGDSIIMPSVFRMVNKGDHSVVLQGRSEHVQVELTYTDVGDYLFDVKAVVKNLTPFAVKFAPVVTVQGLESQNEGSFFAPSYDMLRLKCLVDGDIEDVVTKKHKKDKDYRGEVSWVGADRQYFLAAVGPIPDAKPAKEVCRFNAKSADNYAEASYVMAERVLPANDIVEVNYRAFIGPKMEKFLDEAKMDLDQAVDYVLWGIPLAFLAKPMLWLMGIFFDWTNSYGLAIILLTLVVKLLLMPINHKSMVSMRNMQKLQPKMEEIKNRYPNDQEAQTRELMKFYQTEHINPAAGCLPMFLQMPILCALYRAIGAAVELYQQSFLWIDDLSLAEPIPFMAIAMGLIMILQQKLSTGANKNTNPQQQTQMKVMMYGMPIFMTVIMMALPSGLVLYTLINCILSIFHQLYINKVYKAA